jgi:hypothetical protein
VLQKPYRRFSAAHAVQKGLGLSLKILGAFCQHPAETNWTLTEDVKFVFNIPLFEVRLSNAMLRRKFFRRKELRYWFYQIADYPETSLPQLRIIPVTYLCRGGYFLLHNRE